MKKIFHIITLSSLLTCIPNFLVMASGNNLEKGKTILEKIEPEFYGKPLYLNPNQQLKERIEKELFSAIEYISQAEQEQPSNAEILLLLGKAHSFAHHLNIGGAWQKSTGYLEKYIVLEPTNALAHLYLGKNYMDAERYEDAYQVYKKAYTLDPSSEAQKFMAYSLMFQNKIDEAISNMGSYVASHPRDQEAQNALEALRRGNYDKSIISSDERKQIERSAAFHSVSYSQSVASPGKIETQEDLLQWVTFYYLHKDSSLVVPGIRFMLKSGTFDKGDSAPPMLAFLGSVFKQNEDKIESWLRELDDLTVKEKEWLWIAIALSETQKGKGLLIKLQDDYQGEPKEFLKKRMENDQFNALEDPITQSFHLDMIWGDFLASGDARYVKRIIEVLPWLEPGADASKAVIGAAARWSLTSNAKQHPKVMEICKSELARQSDEVKVILKELIDKAEKA